MALRRGFAYKREGARRRGVNPRRPDLRDIGRGLALAIRFEGINARYGAHQLHFQRRLLNRVAQGSTFDAVSTADIKGLEIPVPDQEEQRRIAEVLDAVEEKIQFTCAVRRQAHGRRIRDRLHDLVTRGIGPDGALRDPDAQPELFRLTALGRIPVDWALSTVDQTFEVKSGITLGPHRAPRRGSSPYLRVANVRRGLIDMTDVARLQASGPEQVEYALRDGDLLVVEGHADVGQIGRCSHVLSPPPGLLYQNHLFRLRSTAVDPVFAEVWLNSAYARAYWRATCSTSSGLNTINSRQLKAMMVVVPTLPEQQRLQASGLRRSGLASATRRPLWLA